MVFVPEISTVNQRTQIGAESTSALGTPVAAGKLLECFDITLGINGDITMYTAGGHKYPQTAEENSEWVDGTLAGNFDYNGIIYPLASVMGNVAAAAHLASVTAKDWIFTPPVTGSIVPRTYTLQQGDSTRARSVAYGLFTEFAYKGTRKDFSCSGKLLAQPLSDGIALTASPTSIPVIPVPAKHVNVYLDATSAALGTTQLLKVLSVDYVMTNVYGPAWFLNRANLGFSSHVDLVPSAKLKLKVEADSVGMSLLTNMQAGSTVYVRVDALGSVAIAADGPGNIFNEMRHDMACKVGKPQPFGDDQGIYAIEWELTVCEDAAWTASGQSQILTVTNLLAAL